METRLLLDGAADARPDVLNLGDGPPLARLAAWMDHLSASPTAPAVVGLHVQEGAGGLDSLNRPGPPPSAPPIVSPSGVDVPRPANAPPSNGTLVVILPRFADGLDGNSISVVEEGTDPDDEVTEAQALPNIRDFYLLGHQDESDLVDVFKLPALAQVCAIQITASSGSLGSGRLELLDEQGHVLASQPIGTLDGSTGLTFRPSTPTLVRPLFLRVSHSPDSQTAAPALDGPAPLALDYNLRITQDGYAPPAPTSTESAPTPTSTTDLQLPASGRPTAATTPDDSGVVPATSVLSTSGFLTTVGAFTIQRIVGDGSMPPLPLVSLAPTGGLIDRNAEDADVLSHAEPPQLDLDRLGPLIADGLIPQGEPDEATDGEATPDRPRSPSGTADAPLAWAPDLDRGGPVVLPELPACPTVCEVAPLQLAGFDPRPQGESPRTSAPAGRWRGLGAFAIGLSGLLQVELAGTLERHRRDRSAPRRRSLLLRAFGIRARP